MINRVVLVGRLTKDPELSRTSSGTPKAFFTLAVDNRVKSGAERTASFIPCIVWNQAAEDVAKFIRKGSLVGVEGRLNQRTYDSKDGRRVTVIEVICDSVQFLEPKGTTTEAPVRDEVPPYEDFNDDAGDNNLSAIDVADDDLPF